MTDVAGRELGPMRAAPAPRYRQIAELTLDRLHRDARVDARWVDLSPVQFALLWEMSASPGAQVSPSQVIAQSMDGECTAGGIERAMAELGTLFAAHHVSAAVEVRNDGTSSIMANAAMTAIIVPEPVCWGACGRPA